MISNVNSHVCRDDGSIFIHVKCKSQRLLENTGKIFVEIVEIHIIYK